jgi:hypothetical protein
MNIKSKLSLFLLVGAIVLTQCIDETVHRNYPKVSTENVNNISADGATFIAEITESGNAEISEHGFVWSTSPTPNLDYSNRIFLGPFNGTGEFTADINTTFIEGKSYYISAFVKSGDYTVYGNIVTFTSLGSKAPVVTGVFPDKAGWGDTITITGEQFSYLRGTNTVYIGGNKVGDIITNTDTILVCRVPGTVHEPRNAVSVEIEGNRGTLQGDSLTFISPEFHDYYPKSAQWGDTVSFYGTHLRCFGDMQGNGVFIGGNLATIYSVEDTVVTVLVPYKLIKVSNDISIKLNGFSFSSDKPFTLLPPVIAYFTPNTGTWGSTITIYGRFNILSSMNSISLNSIKSTEIVASERKLKVTVPSTINDYANAISLTSGPFTIAASDSFYLIKPEIKYFTPTSGCSGTKIKIGGKYFKNGITSVSIGNKIATLASVNDSVIYCYAPSLPDGDYKFTIKTGSSVESVSNYRITNPKITSFSPNPASYYEIVTVKGENFRSGMVWKVGQTEFWPISCTATEAKFYLLHDLLFYTPQKVSASFTLNGITSTVTSEDYLTLKDFTISTITPITCNVGSIVTIEGENFNGAVSDLTVKVGTVSANLPLTSPTKIEFMVPLVPDGSYDITVTSAGRSKVYPEKISVTNSWKRLNDLPFLYDYGCVFDFGEEIYVATAGISSTERDIYTFDINTREFIKTDGTFSSSVVDPVSCTLNGKGYVIGQKTTEGVGFEVFNPDSLTWRKLSDYPGTQQAIPFIVSDDSVVYAGSGRNYLLQNSSYYDTWKYSPKTNKWTKLHDIGNVALTSSQIYINKQILTVSVFKELYQYNASTNYWDRILYNSFYGKSGHVSVVLNGKWYLGCGDDYGIHRSTGYMSGLTNQFQVYNPTTKQWSELCNEILPARSMPLYFTAGGFLFVGGSQRTHLMDFWMYDPSKE